MKKLLLCASAFALMLGSCSKDDTEVAPVDAQGKLAFSAVMTIGNDTRTGVAVDGNRLVYTWDLGDMVGATVAGQSEVVPFINKTTEESAKYANFYYSKEDMNYLGGEKVYLAYPYDKDNTVDADGNIKMTIPAIQRYRAGSFAQMTAPAVAYVPQFEEGAEYAFDAVSSFIRVPVIGSGNVSKIDMQIKKGGSAMKIAGSANVDVDSDNPALTVPADASSWTDKITLDFGKAGLDLSYTEKQYIVYVLPAGLELTANNTVFEFTATFSDQTTSTVGFTVPTDLTMPVNHMQGLGTVSFGTEKMIMINNTEDFLKYAYSVNQGTLSADASYVSGGDFKTAVLLSDLDYSAYDAGKVYAANAAKGDDKDEILEDALQAYMGNGGFEPMAAGANIDGNGNTISGMTVTGNGIFAGAPASLKGLTLSAVTVNVPANANPALFIGTGINPSLFSDVTIGGDSYLRNVAKGATAAMIANAYATTLPTAEQFDIAEYPRVNGSDGAEVYYASKLTLQEGIESSAAYFGETRRFGEITADTKDVTISGVEAASVEYVLDAISETSSHAISVVDKDGTSYWTGLVAASLAEDGKISTAEELAYVVNNGGRNLTLANNIDLQGEEGKVWTVADKTVAIDGGSNTIKNVKIGVYDDTEVTVNSYYSLLGKSVTVSNLTVEDVEITVKNINSKNTAYIGGLGYTGSANNVTVNGMTIDVDAGTVAKVGGNVIGGLISTMTAASYVDNKVSGLKISLGDKEGVTVGGMFGNLNRSLDNEKHTISGNSVVYSSEAAVKYPLLGAWTVFGSIDVAACSVSVGDVTNPIVSTAENPIAPVVGVITFNPTNVTPGTQIWLNFVDGCSQPYYSEIKNALDYSYYVKINGEEVAVYGTEE